MDRFFQYMKILYLAGIFMCWGDLNSYAQLKVCKGNDLQLPDLGVGVIEWRDAQGQLLMINDENGVAIPAKLPIVSPSSSTTYKVSYFLPYQNLFPKGDMEELTQDEVVAIIPHYQYVSGATSMGAGYYSFGDSPQNLWPGVQTSPIAIERVPWYIDMEDHTPGEGRIDMLYFDGQNKEEVVILTQVNVQQGIKYVFSAWFANTHIDLYAPFKMSFRINGAEYASFTGGAGGTVIHPDTNEPIDVGVAGWYQFYAIWESDATGVVEIEIINKETISLYGNDFAIDDVVFAPLIEQEYSVQVIEITSVSLAKSSFCKGGEFFLDPIVSGGDEPYSDYIWDDPQDVLSNDGFKNPTVNTGNPGMYNLGLQVTDSNGCESSIGDFNIEVTNGITIMEPLQNTTCEGVDVRLQPQVLNGLPPYEHIWSGATEKLYPNAQSENPVLNASAVGVFSLSYKVVDREGCPGELLPFNVEVNPKPQVTIDADEVCEGHTVVLKPQISGGSGDYVAYKWSGDTTNFMSPTSGKNAFVYGTKARDKYALYFEVEDSKGCISEFANAEINVLENPQVQLESLDLCRNGYGVLSPKVKAGSGRGFKSYLWSGDMHVVDSSTVANAYLNTSQSGDFYLSYTFKDDNGCVGQAEASVFIDTIEAPHLALDDIAVCSGNELFLVPQIEGGQAPYSSNWTGDNFLLDASNATSPWVDTDVPGAYKLGLYIEDGNACLNYLPDVDVVVWENPQIVNVDKSYYKQISLLVAGGQEPYQYSLDGDAFQDRAVYSEIENGDYLVRVLDQHQCMVEQEVEVRFLDVEITNFFTPNGDGYNDYWVIAGLESMPDATIVVYDRTGKVVFQSKGIDAPWDGRYLGAFLTMNSYWYSIDLPYFKQVIKGAVFITY